MRLPPRRYLFASLAAAVVGLGCLTIYVTCADQYGFSEHTELWEDTAPLAVIRSGSLSKYGQLEGRERDILVQAGMVNNSEPFILGFPAIAVLILLIADLLRSRAFLRRCFIAFVMAEAIGLIGLISWTLIEGKSARRILTADSKSSPLDTDKAFKLGAKAGTLAVQLDLLDNAVPFLIIPALLGLTYVFADAHRRKMSEGSKANLIKN
jgi:hypothetical protein